MLGAIIGDIAGSKYEWRNNKSKEFEFLSQGSRFTDDTVMTLAVLDALLYIEVNKTSDLFNATIKKMQEYGRKYPDAGYGGMFRKWLKDDDPKPYGSWGNGSAMRISPVVYFAKNKVHLFELVDAITSTTHNSPEGIKGARALAWAIYLARIGAEKNLIKREIEAEFYNLDFTIDGIRDNYKFDASCQGSVPQAIVAFLESENFEDSIRIAVSLGGDTDTIASMTGAISEQFYGIPFELQEKAVSFLNRDFIILLEKFKNRKVVR